MTRTTALREIDGARLTTAGLGESRTQDRNDTVEARTVAAS
jgi:hypothetical protein